MAGNSLDRIHSLNAVIEAMNDDIDQTRAELGMLEHIDDDTQRDAAVSEHAEDRQDARMTASDVARMTKHITRLERKRARTVQKRDAVLAKLQAG